MDAQSLVGHLQTLPDASAQQQFLKDHASELSEEVASALKAQADQFLRSDIRRSLQMAEHLYEIARLTGNTLYQALGLLAEANARSIGLGQYQRAIELYDQAADIYRAQGNLVGQAKSQIGKIESLRHLGRYREALDAGKWANEILAASGETRAQATLIMNMGNTYERLGELSKALEMHERAAKIYQQIGAEQEPGWLWIQINRAVVLRILGRFDASIQASQTAWEGLNRLGQRVSAARARQSLALTYYVVGRYNEALELLEHVRDVFAGDGRERDAMLVELFISDCLLQLRRFSDVIDKCQLVRNLFAGLGARYVVAQAIVNEGVAYAELGRYNEALKSLAEARSIFEEGGNHVWLASTDLETAAVLLHQGRFEESLTVALTCAVDFKDDDLPIEVAQARLVAARASLALGRREEALQLTLDTLDVAQNRNVPTLTYRSRQLLGALAASTGELQHALDEYAQAIDELERLRGRLMVEFRAGFLEDKEVIYEDAVDLCLQLDQPSRGLEFAERAKSRALLDLLAQRLDLGIQARDETDRPLVEELMRLRSQRDQLYRRWDSDEKFSERGWTSSSSERQQAQQDVLALEKRITELWHRLLIRNAEYARDAALWHVRTEPIQPYLASDTLLLEYFAIHGQIVVFPVTGDTIHTLRLPAKLTQAQRLMQRLWLNLRTVSRSTSDQIAHLKNNACDLLKQLYEMLVEPLDETVEQYQRLIIVPHGPLHYLPFHALYDGARYLLERHEISYLPSGSFLRYCREAPRAATRSVVIGHSNGGRLPHTLHEARSIAALINGQMLLEEEAGLPQVLAIAADCRVLHLAAHGDFRPDNPLFSGLALADGWLTTLDIFNLRLRASLITLSACQTGRSVVGGGDELLGLMRSFLSAGAASVALSLWAVEDRSTAQLMEIFYQMMVEGFDKGAALRRAQLEILKAPDNPAQGAVNYSHPYFWAPFFLVGDAGPL